MDKPLWSFIPLKLPQWASLLWPTALYTHSIDRSQTCSSLQTNYRSTVLHKPSAHGPVVPKHTFYLLLLSFPISIVVQQWLPPHQCQAPPGSTLIMASSPYAGSHKKWIILAVSLKQQGMVVPPIPKPASPAVSKTYTHHIMQYHKYT